MRHCGVFPVNPGQQVCRVITDMELWTEVRRRVLTGELSKRAAYREYGIHEGGRMR